MPKVKTPAYPVTGYMQGTCPGCKEWEAPITEDELAGMTEKYAHHGSSRKRLDKGAAYHRLIWEERFQCPECKTFFGVKFSSV